MSLPLDGITVLDLCIVLAGPTCGRTLAQYGANVIKIDPHNRKPATTPWLDVGRGKKSINLNIKKPGGLEALLQIADHSDVLVEGFRNGVADRLGFGYEALNKRNPGIVYGSINCFGHSGEWTARPGFEQNAQAATGVQIRNGGPNSKPRPASFTLNDYGTGIAAAYGLMMALLEKKKTGRGQHVQASLAQTSAIISGPQHVNYKTLSRSEYGGPGSRGKNFLCRLYECEDGWIFIYIQTQAELDRFASIQSVGSIFSASSELILNKLLDNNVETFEKSLEAMFLGHTTRYWLTILKQKDVPTVKNTSAEETHNDSWNTNRGMIVENDYRKHPFKKEWGTVTWPGNPVNMSDIDLPQLEPPVFGADTESVLKEFNFTDSEILSLKKSKAI